ncbi:MAG TPA: hypothetical protein VLV16_12050 [Gemmatimonadales bacterium]|nr:hypothetical protein [Gemmatimonadales bacterium]
MSTGHTLRQPTRPIAIAMLLSAALGASHCGDGTLLSLAVPPPPPTTPAPGSPVALAIFVQPTSTGPGAAIAPGVQVVVQDAQGITVTNSTAMITLGISTGTGTAGAVLGGILSRAAVGGIATFSDLTLDKTGPGYTLTATATSLAGATSIPFDVNTPPTVSLQSDPGDWVGQGQTYRYDRGNSLVTVRGTVVGFGGHLDVGVRGDEEWVGGFQMPDGMMELEPGTYSVLGWEGEGRGCNTTTGWFTIDDVTYRNGALAAIDLRFEQHCDGAVPALHGTIHWDADDPTPPPGPVTPMPAGLWQPAAGATPTTGNYVYLVSEVGEPVGQGYTVTYTPANATLTFTSAAAHFDILVDGRTPALGHGYFGAMVSVTELQRGYYPNVNSYPSTNPTRGGFAWNGPQGSFFAPCETIRGWFVVDAVSYSGGTLTAIDVRFEQRCNGTTPALHGAIHWVQ